MTVAYNEIRTIMQPAAWPMSPEAVEARRQQAAMLLGRPFPKLSRTELGKRDIVDLTAATELAMLDALRQGCAPHVAKL
jgi:hypothetical protein